MTSAASRTAMVVAGVAGALLVLPSYASAWPDPPPAPPPPVVRKGFTAEAGASLDALHVAEDDAYSDRGTYGGFSPLVFSIGAFLTRDVALRFHGTASTYIWETGGGTFARVLGYAGPEAQVWLRDDVNVGGGAGVTLWDPGEDPPFTRHLLAGWGFSLFGKWAFLRLPHQAIAVGVEVVPAFLPRAPSSVVTYGLTMSWQYY